MWLDDRQYIPVSIRALAVDLYSSICLGLVTGSVLFIYGDQPWLDWNTRGGMLVGLVTILFLVLGGGALLFLVTDAPRRISSAALHGCTYGCSVGVAFFSASAAGMIVPPATIGGYVAQPGFDVAIMYYAMFTAAICIVSTFVSCVVRLMLYAVAQPSAIGSCGNCGYCLTGLLSRRCPECGVLAVASTREKTTPVHQRPHLYLITLAVGVVFVLRQLYLR